MNPYYEPDLSELYSSVEDSEEFFPDDVKKILEQTRKVLNHINHIINLAFDSMTTDLTKWGHKQYPILKTDKSISLMEYCGTICACDIIFLPFVTYKLTQDKKAGLSPRKLYKEFGKWEKLLATPPKAVLMKAGDRKKFPGLSDGAWKTMCEKHNSDALLYFNFLQILKKDFVVCMNKIMLKHFPEISNFGPDELIVYNYYLSKSFDIAHNSIDRLQKTLVYGFNLDYYDKTKEEFDAAVSKLSKKKRAELKANEKLQWMAVTKR